MSNIPTVQAIYEAFGKGDVPAILAQLDAGVDWEHDGRDVGVPWLAPGRGIGHVQAFFGSLAGFQITKFEPTNLLEGGNQVAAVIRIEATVPATGGQVKDLEMHLWTFGPDGKVTAFRHIVDTAQHIAAYRGVASAV